MAIAKMLHDYHISDISLFNELNWTVGLDWYNIKIFMTEIVAN